MLDARQISEAHNFFIKLQTHGSRRAVTIFRDDKFGDVLEATQSRIEQANKELDKLVGVRTRAIQRKLKAVESIDAPTDTLLIPDED